MYFRIPKRSKSVGVGGEHVRTESGSDRVRSGDYSSPAINRPGRYRSRF